MHLDALVLAFGLGRCLAEPQFSDGNPQYGNDPNRGPSYPDRPGFSGPNYPNYPDHPGSNGPNYPPGSNGPNCPPGPNNGPYYPDRPGSNGPNYPPGSNGPNYLPGSNGPNYFDGPFTGRHEWIPASRINGASRSPCPFLNTAANHGYLPRNGRRIAAIEFNRAIIDTLNFAPDFANTITSGMLTKLNVPLDSSFRIDLGQLNIHGITEHDASISRLDLNQGNNAVPNPTMIQRLLDDAFPRFYPFLNTTSVARTRLRRNFESRRAGNPPLSQADTGAAQGEAALVLLIMSDDVGTVTGQSADFIRVPKDRVRTWLLEERFPEQFGFRIPRREVQTSEHGALVERLGFWEQQEERFGDRGARPGGGFFALNETGGSL